MPPGRTQTAAAAHPRGATDEMRYAMQRLDPQEARQGEKGHGVRWVLMVSTAAAVIALFAILAVFV